LVDSSHLGSKIIHFPVSQEIRPLPGANNLIVGYAVFGQIAGKKGRTIVGWRCVSRAWLKPLYSHRRRFRR
jgi:hypothetical protein